MNGLVLLFVLSAVAVAVPDNLFNQPHCGERPRVNDHNALDKVVGGHQAHPGDWGWMTAMRRNGGFICGGSVVNERWMITAAHCPFGNANPNVYILDVGGHDRNTQEHWVVSMRVDLIKNHEQYSSATLRNDISLMRFSTKLQFDNHYIIPVCLADTNPAGYFYDDWAANQDHGWATGWGTLFSGGSVARYLMQVRMRHLTHSRCQQRFGTSVNTTLQMCGGDVGEGIDTCQGDSGGPYVFKHKKNLDAPGGSHDKPYYSLVGITSWGYGCGDGGVYTRVSGYIPWIQTTLNANRPLN